MTRADILALLYVQDGTALEIEHSRGDGGAWRVKIASPGNPSLLLLPSEAMALAPEFKEAGEDHVAQQLEASSQAALRHGAAPK